MIDLFDWSSFIEVPGFTARWTAIDCTDRDLRQLQLELLAKPNRWPTVPGAGGWRKARFAPVSWGIGTSGAVRVYYAVIGEFGLIILGTAFTKREMSDLPPDAKRSLGRLLRELRMALETDS